MMRPAIGSVLACRIGRNRLPTMRVFGTSVRLDDASPRRPVHRRRSTPPPAFTSSSVIAFASSIIVLVFGLRGSAVCRRPFRKSWIWRMKYGDRQRRPARRFPAAPCRSADGTSRIRASSPEPRRSVRDDVGHRRVIAGKPVDHVLAVADVDERIACRAALELPRPRLLARILVRPQISARRRLRRRFLAGLRLACRSRRPTTARRSDSSGWSSTVA